MYEFGAAFAHDCGVILADTKFEFGEIDGQILVIDEMMTPDSSRYWPAEAIPVGGVAAVVRQAVRARLHGRAPAGTTSRRRRTCRRDAIANTRARYREAYELLTGESLDDWFGPDDD